MFNAMFNLYFRCFLLSFVFSSFFSICVSGYKSGISDGRLSLLTIVHRHGERTPYKFFANDPYSDPKYWPDGEVELISSGRQRMYQLGVSIREKYSSFIEDNPRLVYARSSDADRCIESSELVLHGIFKAAGRWIYSNETKYLPIPIHTVPTAHDSMLTTDVDCPEASMEKKRLLHSDTAKAIMNKYSGTLDVIRQETGNVLQDLSSVSDFYITLEIESENIKDWKKPEWYTDKVREELHIMSDAGMYIAQSSFRILRLRTSNFFADLRRRINAKLYQDTRNGGNLKLISYSTHDNLLASILIALGIFDNKMPPYGASLIFELILADKPFIKTYYWNDTTSEPNQIALPACDNHINCSTDRFIHLISPYILDDWEHECGLKRAISLWSSWIFVSLVAILGLIIVSGLVWFMAIQWQAVNCDVSIELVTRDNSLEDQETAQPLLP